LPWFIYLKKERDARPGNRILFYGAKECRINGTRITHCTRNILPARRWCR
jgi:hypothetical protein